MDLETQKRKMFGGILKSFLAFLTKMLDGYLFDLRSSGITSIHFSCRLFSRCLSDAM
jgi:hypothetical protein